MKQTEMLVRNCEIYPKTRPIRAWLELFYPSPPPPQKVIENSNGVGGGSSQKPKFLKESKELNCNWEGDSSQKIFLWWVEVGALSRTTLTLFLFQEKKHLS